MNGKAAQACMSSFLVTFWAGFQRSVTVCCKYLFQMSVCLSKHVPQQSQTMPNYFSHTRKLLKHPERYKLFQTISWTSKRDAHVSQWCPSMRFTRLCRLYKANMIITQMCVKHTYPKEFPDGLAEENIFLMCKPCTNLHILSGQVPAASCFSPGDQGAHC